MSIKIDRINKPPIQVEDASDFSWKKWFDSVYLQFYNEDNPNAIVTSNTTLALGFFIPVDATAGNIVITIPYAADAKWKKYIIKKIDSSANTVTITAQSSDNIDGASTKVISHQNETYLIGSDGNLTWYILGSANSAGGTSGAPVDATYVVMSSNATLTQERVLTAGTGITIVDGGPNSTVTISSTGGGTQQPLYVYFA